MQFTRNILEDDEQHFPGITTQRSTSKLYGQFHNTSRDQETIGRKNNLILENSGETQSVFQKV